MTRISTISIYSFVSYFLFSLDVPFTSGHFVMNSIAFNTLKCSGIQSDTGIHYIVLYIVASQNLKNKIAAIIPNCVTPPVCTTGQETITLVRTTKGWAYEEDFFIRDSNNVVRFRQPAISNNQQYTWSVTLCQGLCTILMTDSLGDSWSSNSNVVIKKGSTTIGTFRCLNSHSTTSTFTVYMAHELYVLFGNARERENFFWKQVRIHEFHLENQ